MVEEEVSPPAEVQGWPVTSESDELCRLRRDAESLGLAVTKIPQRCRSFHEFGPYMLTKPGAGYAIVASGLELEDVEKWLRAHRHKSVQWRRYERGTLGG
jgi:hypothetical protein